MAAPGRQLPSCRHRLETFDQPVFGAVFEDDATHVAPQGLYELLVGQARGQEDDRRGVAIRMHRRQHFYAVATGHHDVENDDIGAMFGNCCKRFVTIGDAGDNRMTRQLEDLAYRRADERVVVGQNDAAHVRRPFGKSIHSDV